MVIKDNSSLPHADEIIAQQWRDLRRDVSLLDPSKFSDERRIALGFVDFVDQILDIRGLRQGGIDVDPDIYKRDGGTKIEMRQLWNETAGAWPITESPYIYMLTMETLFKFLQVDSDKTGQLILSEGSGPGLYETYMGNYLRGIGGFGVDILPVDYSEKMVTINREILSLVRQPDGKPLGNVSPAVMDIEDLSLGDKSVDQILCNNALHVVNDPKRAISEMARVIDPDGLAWLYLFIEQNSRGIKREDLLDELEAQKFVVYDLREFSTQRGQLDVVSSRLFVRAKFIPDKSGCSWRKGFGKDVTIQNGF